MAALSAGFIIAFLGLAAYAVIAGIVTAYLCFDTWLAQPQPRTAPPAPAMSDKAFFMIAYSVMLLAAFWLVQR